MIIQISILKSSHTKGIDNKQRDDGYYGFAQKHYSYWQEPDQPLCDHHHFAEKKKMVIKNYKHQFRYPFVIIACNNA